MKHSANQVEKCITYLANFDCENLIEKYKRQKKMQSEELEDTITEIYSAYLLSGVSSTLRSLPESNIRTADLLATIGNIDIEFEVTNSRQKAEQQKMSEFASLLTQRLNNLGASHTYRIRFTEILEMVELNDLVDQVQQDAVGSIRFYRDAVRVEKFESGSAWPQETEWLPNQYATPVTLTFSTNIEFRSGRVISHQQSDCRWVLSTKAYFNSLRKKWDASQASGTRPFVVICDVTQLPGAFGWFDANLPAYCTDLSTNISGILLIKRQFESTGFQIRTKYFENSSCQKKLPHIEQFFSNPVMI